MENLTNGSAVILAGGLGTRLRSAVPDGPKVLAEVGGRPFIEYLLDQLASAGVQSVVICTGYLGDSIRDRLGARYRTITLCYSREELPLGTGGALRLALPMLNFDPVLVLNGDSYCDTQLGPFANWHAAHQSAATILLVETDDTLRFGRVHIDQEGCILGFFEKSDDPGPGLVNAGIYLLKRDVIASIVTGRAVSIEREVFPAWVGHGLHGFRTHGRLWDIGVPNAYALAKAEFVSSISR